MVSVETDQRVHLVRLAYLTLVLQVNTQIRLRLTMPTLRNVESKKNGQIKQVN